jgi:glycosyltransferase involved in cell wall biosynthesis
MLGDTIISKGANERNDVVVGAPKISWILCSHLVDAQLRLALQSCLDQTYPNFELLVVANGDNAESISNQVKDWIGKDPRVRVFQTSVKHLPFSLSLGLHHARGGLIARMDSDDVSKPFRLELQVRYMDANPSVAILGTAYEVVDEFGMVKRKVWVPTTDREIRHGLRTRNPLCHPSVMFRRDVVLKAGGYLGGLHAEDYDLWLRLTAEPGLEFANLPDICLSYREVGVSGVRRAHSAYASVAASQLRQFLISGHMGWIFATLLTVIKLLLRTNGKK